jgi:glycosyltransferase involved in cell wall biosynthesis
MSEQVQPGDQGGRAPRPIRVLHVLAELKPSGAEVMLVVAAPHFAREGVTCEIVATGAERGPFAGKLEGAGYAVHHLPFSKTPGFFLGLWRLMRRGYDAVHVHTERAAFWIGLTTLGAGIPVVVRSIHNAYDFTGNLRLRRKAQRHVMSWLRMRHVAVGPSVRETERLHYGLEAPVINNWFDAERFRPADEAARREARRALAVDEGEAVLVSVANCNAFKNHPALIRALALLPKARRPLWLHVGAEEAGHPERDLARALGVADRIRFLGSRDDVGRLLHAADAFVMPSTQEGLPISALEAMASGLPAILTDVNGLRDLRPTFPGLLFAEPTPASLAEALLAFTEQDAAGWREAAAGYPAIVRREYGVEAGVAAYVRLYRGAR